jgi:putative ATP-binding cassette transporter
MQLVAFSAVLWSISHLLVGVLAVYALLGTVVALYIFGNPLIQLNFWQLRREADFRFSLMRLRENAESIAFYRGEAQERAHIDSKFDKVIHNFSRLIKKQRSLNLFQRTFSQLALVLPGMILANGVLSGELEVGRAIQATGAFTAVLGAVGVIVDNFESLSRFVAGHRPPAGLVRPGAAGAQAANGPPQAPAHRNARPAAPRAGIGDAASAAIGTGAHQGAEPGAEAGRRAADHRRQRLRQEFAAAGDRGPVAHRQRHDPSSAAGRFLLPAAAALPAAGHLRSQLIYPSAESGLSDEQLLAILEQVHLPHLAERVGGLDAVQDWEKLLSVGEQQRLAFGRVLVHEPASSSWTKRPARSTAATKRRSTRACAIAAPP